MLSWCETIESEIEFNDDDFDLTLTTATLVNPEQCKEPVILQCSIDGGTYNLAVLSKDRPTADISAHLYSDYPVVLSLKGKGPVNVFGILKAIYNPDEDADKESFDEMESDEFNMIYTYANLPDDFDNDEDSDRVETSGPIIEEIFSDEEQSSEPSKTNTEENMKN